MEIVHLIKGKASLEAQNGVSKVVYSLSEEQARQGHDVSIWCIAKRTPLFRKGPPGVPCDYLGDSSTDILKEFGLIRRLLRLAPATIVHFHSVFVPEFLVAAFVLRVRGIPYVVTPHGGYSSSDAGVRKLKKSIFFLLFEKRLLQRARAVHLLGRQGEAKKLTGVASRVVLVPNGQSVPLVKKENWASGSHLSLVYCGRLAVEQKGLDLLIEAIGRAGEIGLDVRLDIIGAGAGEAVLREISRSQSLPDSRIRYLGYLTGSEKEMAICNADLFIHPSRWEGLPTAVLEALALGMPVAVTPETNLHDLVLEHNCGITIQKPTVTAIVDALQAAVEAKAEQKFSVMGRNGREIIQRKFGWDGIARQIVSDLYDPVSNGQTESAVRI